MFRASIFNNKLYNCIILEFYQGYDKITSIYMYMCIFRAQDCIERLCVLCIQALAEMNKWQDVLPLIQDVYNSIELCPCIVIQLW